VTLSQWWRRRRDARALQQRAVPDDLWWRTIQRYPFLARNAADDAELRRLVSLFLDRKEFSGAHGLVVTDAMAVAIAAQACLPMLRLGLSLYDRFVGIVVHRDEVIVAREWIDPDGVVHEYDEVLSGEAMERGPMMLSWRDVDAAGESAQWAYNVVIHEFMHVVDMADGVTDGIPPMTDRDERERWATTLEMEYGRFCRRVDDEQDTVLDPYGVEGPEEFFAVAAEAFFVSPRPMRAEHPRLYTLFADYFLQDPATL